MAELVSAFPTAGGIYWWSSRLGNPMWGWFTGWFNLLGLIAILASVDYFCAQFLGIVLGLYKVNILGLNFGDANHGLRETFILFALILGLHVVHQHPRQPPRRGVQRRLRVVARRRRRGDHRRSSIFVPDNHASFNTVFTDRINNSGFSHGMFWWYVLPLGFLLTQYTITGFDASAHISEETHDSENAAPKGVWRSVFYSAVIGYVLLLAITFAAVRPDGGHRGRRRLARRVPERDGHELGEGRSSSSPSSGSCSAA